MTTRRRLGLELLVLLAAIGLAILAIHPELVLQGKIYSSTDAEAAEAFRVIGEASSAAGEYPLWNPFVFAGMPSYASLGYTPGVYPLQVPVAWLVAHLPFPPMTWLLLHLLLAGTFTAAYARWRGLSLPASAVAGALVVGLAQVTAWSAYGHGTKLATFAWLPLTLWCMEGVLRQGRWIFVFGLAASAAMQLLRAHVQILYYTAMAGALWALLLLWPMLRDPKQRSRALARVGKLATAAALALGCAAVLYLPIWEYQAHSIRGSASQGGGTTYEYATAWSLPWTEIATFWWPTASGFGRASYVGGMPFTDYPNYLGFPLLLLAIVAVWLRRDRWCVWLAVVAVVATLVGLGRHGPLYELFYNLAPGFKKFRVPVMILILQQYAVVLLAAAGLDVVIARLAPPGGERSRWLGRPLAVVLGLVGLVLLALGTVGAEGLRRNAMVAWQRARPTVSSVVLPATARLASADASRMGLLLLACCATGVAVARRRVSPALGTSAVGLVLFVDFWAVDRPILRPERALTVPAQQGDRVVAVPSPKVLSELSTLRDAMASSPLARWLKQQEARPRAWPLGRLAQDNALAAQQVVSLGGYHAAKLRVYEDVRSRLYDRERPEVRLANLLAASWVVLEGPLQEDAFPALASLGMQLDPQPAYGGEDGVVYRNLSAQPRAWLVDRYELEAPADQPPAVEPTAAVLERVLADGFDAAATAILSAPPVPAPQAGDTRGSARVVSETFHQIEVAVTAPRPMVLVMADIYYPGWKVTIGGAPATLLRADHALRAVAVPAGEHRVRLRFQDGSFVRGRVISLLSAGVVVLGLLGTIWRARRPTGIAA